MLMKLSSSVCVCVCVCVYGGGRGPKLGQSAVRGGGGGGKKEEDEGFVCVCVLSFKLLNQLTDFHKAWYDP
jgi:hypothetical protein